MQRKNYLGFRQHEFRGMMSCIINLLGFYNRMRNGLQKERLVRQTVFLDFQKAFDTILHKILGKKKSSFHVSIKNRLLR